MCAHAAGHCPAPSLRTAPGCYLQHRCGQHSTYHTLQPQSAEFIYSHCSPSLQYLPTHCSASLQNSYTHTISFQLPVSSHIEVPACICQSALSNQCVFLTVHCCRPNLLHCVENPISTHPIRQETRHIKIYEPEMFVGLVGHEFLVLFPASHFPL